jgi:putative FmdB family regulatory protein
MPIYAYRCSDCGHAQDVLQRMSDPVLTVCPSCGANSYTKQVTAAGFQLKGSGWYVTDFRGGNTPAPKVADAGDNSKPTEQASEKPSDKGDSKAAVAGAEKTSSAPASAPAAAPAPAPAVSAPAPSTGS